MSNLAMHIVGLTTVPCFITGFLSSCHSQCFCNNVASEIFFFKKKKTAALQLHATPACRCSPSTSQAKGRFPSAPPGRSTKEHATRLRNKGGSDRALNRARDWMESASLVGPTPTHFAGQHHQSAWLTIFYFTIQRNIHTQDTHKAAWQLGSVGSNTRRELCATLMQDWALHDGELGSSPSFTTEQARPAVYSAFSSHCHLRTTYDWPFRDSLITSCALCVRRRPVRVPTRVVHSCHSVSGCLWSHTVSSAG